MCLLVDAIDVDILVKNVEAIRHRLVKEFIRDRLKRTGKCLLCTARIRPIRKERQGKVVLIGKLKEEVYETPRFVHFSLQESKYLFMAQIIYNRT